MNLKQEKNESLRDYLNCFTKEALKLPDIDEKVVMIALQQGKLIHPKTCSSSKIERGNISRQKKSMRKTTILVAINGNGSNKRKGDQEYDVRDKYSKANKDFESPLKKNSLGSRFAEYARLNTPWSQIPMGIEKDQNLRWNKNAFYRFHKDTVHNTNDCRQLKDEIKFLIWRGKLFKFNKYRSRDIRDDN